MRFRTLLLSMALGAVFLVACGDDDDDASDPTASSDEPTAVASSTDEASEPGDLDDLGPAEHDGERTMEHVEHLAVTIGPRVSGTPGADAATAYIGETLASYGYAVEEFAFQFDSGSLRPGTVTVGDDVIDGLSLQGGAPGPASGELVFVGSGSAGEVGDTDLAGKIAVAERDDVTFKEKVETATEAGAVGLIVVNHSPAVFSGLLQQEARIPAIGVSSSGREALLEAAENGGSAEITILAQGRTPAVNVVARASESAACEVLVGGHHDTVLGAPGANDNASGSSHVLELARAFAADGLDEGLCFATFGAEEFGLIGSGIMAGAWDQEGELPRYMVNLDVTGIGPDVEVIGSEELVQQALALAEGAEIPAALSSLPPNSGSDHQSFEARGVPVLFLTSGDFGTIHTEEDVLPDVEPDEIERVGDVAYLAIEALLAEVAGADGQN